MSEHSKTEEAQEIETTTLPGPVADAAPTAAAPVDADALEARIVEALRTVYDPEIPVDIYELGLIYDIAILDDAKAHVRMTLTSPACPVAGSLPGEVEMKVRDVPGVGDAQVDLVWDPPWDPKMMSEAARLELGML